jgi:hypothetical protein
MMEGRLAYTKAELGITDAQTAAWDGYVTAVKARASNMQDMHTAMMQAMEGEPRSSDQHWQGSYEEP